jgi:hypothetical protein
VQSSCLACVVSCVENLLRSSTTATTAARSTSTQHKENQRTQGQRDTDMLFGDLEVHQVAFHGVFPLFGILETSTKWIDD